MCGGSSGRHARSAAAGGAVAEGSACEWKPGAGKAKKKQQEAHDAVQSGSACDEKCSSVRTAWGQSEGQYGGAKNLVDALGGGR